MPELKPSLSPLKKVKTAFSRSPKSPTENTPTIVEISTAASRTADLESRMEATYFDDPQSRECLSVNPGDHLIHSEERKNCTNDNWKAEIERRIVAKSTMVDHAYGDEEALREKAYGHGNGQK